MTPRGHATSQGVAMSNLLTVPGIPVLCCHWKQAIANSWLTAFCRSMSWLGSFGVRISRGSFRSFTLFRAAGKTSSSEKPYSAAAFFQPFARLSTRSRFICVFNRPSSTSSKCCFKLLWDIVAQIQILISLIPLSKKPSFALLQKNETKKSIY